MDTLTFAIFCIIFNPLIDHFSCSGGSVSFQIYPFQGPNHFFAKNRFHYTLILTLGDRLYCKQCLLKVRSL